MSDIPTWSDLRAALNGNADDQAINERLFARFEGWGYPLYGAAETTFEEDFQGHDYLDRMEVASGAVIEMFGSLVWDDQEYEPVIGLERKDGVWTARVEIDGRRAEAASEGAMTSALAMAAQDVRPGAAILKAAIEIRHVLQMAREAAQTPEP